jgi:hypothetical protein
MTNDRGFFPNEARLKKSPAQTGRPAGWRHRSGTRRGDQPILTSARNGFRLWRGGVGMEPLERSADERVDRGMTLTRVCPS